MSGILIVDDNANIQELLRSLIENNIDFTVCGEAENGAEALERAKNLHPDFGFVGPYAARHDGHTSGDGSEAGIAPREDHIVYVSCGRRESVAGPTFQIDRVIAKSESIRTLRAHLNELLTPVNGPLRHGGVTERPRAMRDRSL
jgi:DNA-binding NarL/FixJ family response regulator